jgi:hypothetical protein
MVVGIEKGLQDGNPLGCNPELPLPEFSEDFIQALLRVVHMSTITLNGI